MKCLKKFLALGMCAGVMSTSSCSAILPDEVMKFYLSTGIDNVILKSQEGLSAICYFLNGGYGPKLTSQAALENYLEQVYIQMGNNRCSLSSHLAAHLEGIREKASVLFTLGVQKDLRFDAAGRSEAQRRLEEIVRLMLEELHKEEKSISNLSDEEIGVLIGRSARRFLRKCKDKSGERLSDFDREFKMFVKSSEFTVDYVRVCLSTWGFRFSNNVLSKLFDIMTRFSVSVPGNLTLVDGKAAALGFGEFDFQFSDDFEV